MFARMDSFPAVGMIVITPDDAVVGAPFTRVEGPTSTMSATKSTALY